MEISNNYINEIKKILKNARQKAYTAVNSAMVEAYWEIGRRIVEEECKKMGLKQMDLKIYFLKPI